MDSGEDYNDEEYGLFRMMREKKLSNEDMLKRVEILLKAVGDDGKAKIRPEARHRAMYVAVVNGRIEVYNNIRGNIPGSCPRSDTNPTLQGSRRRGDDPEVLEAMEDLLNNVPDVNPYYRDRDGQSLLHYIAKDGHIGVFEKFINQGYNPLFRDRAGNTAWDLARRAWDQGDRSPPEVSHDIIQKYLLQAYTEEQEPKSANENKEKSSENICVVQLAENYDPTDEVRFLPREFLVDESPCWEQEEYKTIKNSVRDDNKTIWIALDVNDDTIFTAILDKVCTWKEYNENTISRILDFHSQTFLEQDQGEPRLKFRQPLYMTYTQEVRLARHSSNNTAEHTSIAGKAVDIASIVIPYFDAGDPNRGLRAIYLNSATANRVYEGSSTNGERASTQNSQDISKALKINIHLQRTLDESYFLGLNRDEVMKRKYSEILNADKFKPKTDDTLIVSQLWLWKIGNVLITAIPRYQKHKSSHLFNHSLSLLRGVGSDARKGITSDQLGAWILSECIHRLDYPCLADLKEPILYFLGKVVAFTLDEVETHIEKKGRTRDIKEEKKYIGQLNAARMKLTMIKNIILRQEEVWNAFSPELATKVWRNDSDKETRAKIESVTHRPAEDFARLKLRIQRIDDDAERVERLMLVELDLKSKHAALTEAHRSTILSRAVIGLTVITIIYAPLTLMVGLFALPIDQLNADKINNNYTTDYMVKWMVRGEAISWALTIIIVIVALIPLHYVQIIPITAIRRRAEEITLQTLLHWVQKIPNNAIRKRTENFITEFMDKHKFEKERKAPADKPTEPTTAACTSSSRAYVKGFLKRIGRTKSAATSNPDNLGTELLNMA